MTGTNVTTRTLRIRNERDSHMEMKRMPIGHVREQRSTKIWQGESAFIVLIEQRTDMMWEPVEIVCHQSEE